MVAFWGAEEAKLYAALNQYHLNIIEPERTYNWQLAMLPLALNYHMELCSGPKVRKTDGWELPRRYIMELCRGECMRRAGCGASSVLFRSHAAGTNCAVYIYDRCQSNEFAMNWKLEEIRKTNATVDDDDFNRCPPSREKRTRSCVLNIATQ